MIRILLGVPLFGYFVIVCIMACLYAVEWIEIQRPASSLSRPLWSLSAIAVHAVLFGLPGFLLIFFGRRARRRAAVPGLAAGVPPVPTRPVRAERSPLPPATSTSVSDVDAITSNQAATQPRSKETDAFWGHCVGISSGSNEDPRAAAWCALWYILCAHRSKHTMWYGSERVDFWQPIKDQAVDNARKAVSLLDKSSPNRKFAASLLAGAEALECKPEERTEGAASVVPAVRYSTVDIASYRAGVTRDELLEFARRFEGHEWLTESQLVVEPPSRSGCLGMVVLSATGLAGWASMAWLWLTNG